jgi:phosphoglycolate phosphatase
MRAKAIEAMQRHGTVPERPELPTMELLALMGASLSATEERRLRDDVLAAVRAVEVEAARKSSLFPFVLPLFAACRDKGLSTGIVTRNCPEAVRIVFPEVESLCPCLLTRDHVPLVKPHPDHLLRALAILGKKPEEALMVGDHPMDIETGRSAGCRTAGVASGGTDLSGLAAEHPDYLAENAGCLIRALGILSF